MLKLNDIRAQFQPYVPVRWDVSFSDTTLNLVGNLFTASNVTWEDAEVKSEEVPFGPNGQSIKMNVGRELPNNIAIEFYDNNVRAVYKYVKQLLGLNANKINFQKGTGLGKLTSSNGGFESAGGGWSNAMQVTINEYDNALQVISTWVYYVQLDGSEGTALLQDPVAAKNTLRCNIIGIIKEP